MPRKGTARVKKVDKYIAISDSDNFVSSGEEEARVAATRKKSPRKKAQEHASEEENIDPAVARDRLNLSSSNPSAEQPRQDSVAHEQSKALASALFPEDTLNHHEPPEPFLKQSRKAISQDVVTDEPFQQRDPDTMIQGGAFIASNQQRHMRACMVCSIVRTQQQFLTQGCPNCEPILELAGNSDQINDCTSQVFEGLITVADTSRSWVARYQRLEGYVPGVYATQVEGILPDDVLSAVENAGINYVPRDGSEQEMLGKD